MILNLYWQSLDAAALKKALGPLQSKFQSMRAAGALECAAFSRGYLGEFGYY
jgi:hypothetical protein